MNYCKRRTILSEIRDNCDKIDKLQMKIVLICNYKFVFTQNTSTLLL